MTSSNTYKICPGLPADWLNAWLAAVGTTILVPGLRLSWTTDALPIARLQHDSCNPVTVLIENWPSRERLETMPLAAIHPDCNEQIRRQVSIGAFQERIRATIKDDDSWTLTSTMTDLALDNGKVTHGSFDVPGPGSIKWLHDRLLKTSSHVTDPAALIPDTLSGVAEPVVGNGLGFDLHRLKGGKVKTHPVIETLSFFGLALFPVRGDAIESRNQQARQRGWQIGGDRGFKWPAWCQPLDHNGIDALLDAWYASWRYRKSQSNKQYEWIPANKSMWKRLGIHTAWQSTRYRPAARAETNRGFGSRRLNPI